MTEIKLQIPDASARALAAASDALALELRMAAAVKLFEMGRLSSGAAAGLAGIPRAVFLSRLGEYAADTFRLSRDELVADFGDRVSRWPGVSTGAVD